VAQNVTGRRTGCARPAVYGGRQPEFGIDISILIVLWPKYLQKRHCFRTAKNPSLVRLGFFGERVIYQASQVFAVADRHTRITPLPEALLNAASAAAPLILPPVGA
jgi:hypothetical protein